MRSWPDHRHPAWNSRNAHVEKAAPDGAQARRRKGGSQAQARRAQRGKCVHPPTLPFLGPNRVVAWKTNHGDHAMGGMVDCQP
jgi:hypothetical protein